MRTDQNSLRMYLKNALDNLWARITGMFSGLDDRVTALEQGGGGGGGGQVNVIEAISFNGSNVPPDANKRVSLSETDPTVPAWAKAASKPTYTASEVGAAGSDAVLATSTAFPIPASGSSVSYSMAGLTAEHQLMRWNFSASLENVPPASLSWDTYSGYFTITNTGGATSESMRPVFALPLDVAITSR